MILPVPQSDQSEPYDRLISLGNFCQTAAQIRRFTGKNTEGLLFDWTLTNWEGLIKCVSNNFVDFFKLPNLQTHRGDDAVLDVATGFEFSHLYGVKGNRKVSPEIIARDYSRAYATVRFMVREFNNCLDEERVLLIRQGDGEPETILRFWSALESAHPNGRFELLVLNNRTISTQIDHAHIRVDVVQPPSPGPNDWQGDNESWEIALNRHAPRNSRNFRIEHNVSC